MNIYWVILLLCLSSASYGQQTEVQYLSGKGSDDMIQWDFYCTGGMNANKWTKIGVPSCWELQGFGKYDYGFAKDSVKGKEQGKYRYQFNVPESWNRKVVHIVFEGVMTDAEVRINRKLAGPVHQGAFYAFKYDISKLLKYSGKNLLEVTVSKHSANKSVNAAEREGDFWIFGGIFRPVWLEALPQNYISDIGIDAGADGHFRAVAASHGNADRLSVSIFDNSNKKITEFSGLPATTQTKVFKGQVKNPLLWSSESPNLYKAVFKLYQNGIEVHAVEKKFGFRTVEVKQRDGIYVNGVKMKFKGINRHSFRPESGRTTSYKNSVEDVLLIKEMNMNAVRMSHYPPDGHFLDVCDSLGLFVMDELAGWHGHYDMPTGKKLLKEMISHDVNHPSVVIWSNGNEGGHNFELDPLFVEFDIQKRPVVHPWQLFNGIETQHYRQYNYGIGNYDNGREIVMPTEFLHGQYDGGHGAGLEDYWNKMWYNPLSAGGFLWDFADQAVVRKDLHDSLDTDKDRGADGIVGPHHEKEGSFFAVKEIWSPVFFERREITPAFDGTFTIENRYQFTNLSQCKFSWVLKKFSNLKSVEKSGNEPSPDVAPGNKGLLAVHLPPDWNTYDVLYLTARDQNNRELFTWSFPISNPLRKATELVKKEGTAKIRFQATEAAYKIQIKDILVVINKNTGLLMEVKNSKGIVPLTNGPVVQEGVTNFKNFSHRFEGNNLVIESAFNKQESFNTLQWTFYPSGWLRMEVHYFPQSLHTNRVGVDFSYPEAQMRSVTYMGNGPYRVWKNRLKGTQFGRWNKMYNTTETGQQWVYPEFKGYYSNFYNGSFKGKQQQFRVVTETEDLFLRLFTPAWKTDQWHNYEPLFPDGDLSFMQAIPAIGNKTQTSETTGPMGAKNIFYDYEKDPARALKMVLWFNFENK